MCDGTQCFRKTTKSEMCVYGLLQCTQRSHKTNSTICKDVCNTVTKLQVNGFRKKSRTIKFIYATHIYLINRFYTNVLTMLATFPTILHVINGKMTSIYSQRMDRETGYTLK